MKKKARDLVDWNDIINEKNLAEWFIELAKLDEINSRIIRGRRDNRTQIEVSLDSKVSLETIKKRTKKLIIIYIKTQKKFPEILPLIKAGYYIEKAVITITTDDEKHYKLLIEDELFESFEHIVSEVRKRLKANGYIITGLSYQSEINGSYTCFNLKE